MTLKITGLNCDKCGNQSFAMHFENGLMVCSDCLPVERLKANLHKSWMKWIKRDWDGKPDLTMRQLADDIEKQCGEKFDFKTGHFECPKQ